MISNPELTYKTPTDMDIYVSGRPLSWDGKTTQGPKSPRLDGARPPHPYTGSWPVREPTSLTKNTGLVRYSVFWP